MKDKLINKTIGKFLEDIAIKYPNNLAVKYTDRNYTRTYKEFNEECDIIAKSFLRLGIKKGDHIAIWASNIPEWLLTFFACIKIGAVLVTVNTAYKAIELKYVLKQSDTKLLVLMEGFKDNNYIQILNEVFPKFRNNKNGKLDSRDFPFLEHIVLCSKKKYPGIINFKELYNMENTVSEKEFQEIKSNISPDDIANIQYTSGTTGFPKGVMLTHFNILNNGFSIGNCMNFSKKDKLLITVPFFHCFGLVLAVMACLTHVSSMIPIDIFSPKKVIKAISNEKCTALHGVPTMFISILNQPDLHNYDFSNLRTGIMAGSTCPTKVMREVMEKMGMREITIAYGLTEASPVCTQTTINDSIETRVTTVGKALSNIECKIIDPLTGIELPINTPGEFCVKGYNVMKGYYKMPEETSKVIDKDGWLHSGDLAMVDSKGYYRITGRIKDMIIRGGENIYPKEIEEFLYSFDEIKDIQVVGVPSEYYGEEICACIILNEGKTLSEKKIKNAIKQNLAKHKVPKYYWFMDSFPMTASGKIQKFKLKEMATKKFNK